MPDQPSTAPKKIPVRAIPRVADASQALIFWGFLALIGLGLSATLVWVLRAAGTTSMAITVAWLASWAVWLVVAAAVFPLWAGLSQPGKFKLLLGVLLLASGVGGLQWLSWSTQNAGRERLLGLWQGVSQEETFQAKADEASLVVLVLFRKDGTLEMVNAGKKTTGSYEYSAAGTISLGGKSFEKDILRWDFSGDDQLELTHVQAATRLPAAAKLLGRVYHRVSAENQDLFELAVYVGQVEEGLGKLSRNVKQLNAQQQQLQQRGQDLRQQLRDHGVQEASDLKEDPEVQRLAQELIETLTRESQIAKQLAQGERRILELQSQVQRGWQLIRSKEGSAADLNKMEQVAEILLKEELGDESSVIGFSSTELEQNLPIEAVLASEPNNADRQSPKPDSPKPDSPKPDSPKLENPPKENPE